MKNIKTIAPAEIMRMRIAELKGTLFSENPSIAKIPGFCEAQTATALQALFNDTRFTKANQDFVNCVAQTDNAFIVVKDVELHSDFSLVWEVDGCGSGIFHFSTDEMGRLIINADGMSRHFVRSILLTMVDVAVVT